MSDSETYISKQNLTFTSVISYYCISALLYLKGLLQHIGISMIVNALVSSHKVYYCQFYQALVLLYGGTRSNIAMEYLILGLLYGVLFLVMSVTMSFSFILCNNIEIFLLVEW